MTEKKIPVSETVEAPKPLTLMELQEAMKWRTNIGRMQKRFDEKYAVRFNAMFPAETMHGEPKTEVKKDVEKN